LPFNTADNARFLHLVAVVTTAVAVVIAIGLTPATAVAALLGFADFWCGVIALLSFTGAVVWGQISIERRVLAPRDRLWAQAVHRGLGVLGLGSLALHVTAKIAYGHASSAAVVPLDWTLCDGHALCADMVPELIQVGQDGYPVLSTATIPPYLAARAKAAVRRCPALALRVEGTLSDR
jgi:ferredoxin